MTTTQAVVQRARNAADLIESVRWPGNLTTIEVSAAGYQDFGMQVQSFEAGPAVVDTLLAWFYYLDNPVITSYGDDGETLAVRLEGSSAFGTVRVYGGLSGADAEFIRSTPGGAETLSVQRLRNLQVAQRSGGAR
jgi:hypothetical protein